MTHGGRYNIDAENRAISKISVECGMKGRGVCLIKFKVKSCKSCNKSFKPNSSRHAYCGSWKVRNTCAYMIYYLHRRGRRYGIAGKYIQAMHSSQSGMCAICGKDICDISSYNVDHNHVTGKVRGLLCRVCNIGISHIEKEGWLDKALKYLEIHKIKNI